MPTLGLSSLRFPVIKEPISELFVVGVDTFTNGFDFDANRINISNLVDGNVQPGDTLVFFAFAGQKDGKTFPNSDNFEILDSSNEIINNLLWNITSQGNQGSGDDLYSVAGFYDVTDLGESFKLDGVADNKNRVAESSTLLFVVTLRNSSRKDILQSITSMDGNDLAGETPPAQTPTTDGALIIHVAAIGSDVDNVPITNSSLDNVVSLSTDNAIYQSASAAVGFHTWTVADGSYSPSEWDVDWPGNPDSQSSGFMGAVTFRPNL